MRNCDVWLWFGRPIRTQVLQWARHQRETALLLQFRGRKGREGEGGGSRGGGVGTMEFPRNKHEPKMNPK